MNTVPISNAIIRTCCTAAPPNFVTKWGFWHNAMVRHRDGFRGCRALGHLSFGAPSRCDLFGRLSEKRESTPLLCVAPPQKYIFCCTDFGSTFALNVQQNLKLFLHSSQEQTALRSFIGIYSSFA